MECKALQDLKQYSYFLGDLIETSWNVKVLLPSFFPVRLFDLIETSWNVKSPAAIVLSSDVCDLIETSWNVKQNKKEW